MTFWITLAVISQLFFATTALIDKYIVTSGKVSKPVVLAFYVGLMSSLTAVVFLFGWVSLPFNGISIPSFSNVSWPTFEVAWLSILAGFSFIGALVFLFSALKRADASDVVPVSASMSAVSSLALGLIFLGNDLTSNFVFGVVVLVFGMLLVSLFQFSRKVLLFSMIAGTFFGTHFVLVKLVFNETVFDNGFLWTRLGIVLASLFLLLLPACHSDVKEHKGKTTRKKLFAWILGNKVLAGIAGILSLKAIELGDVSVVQALGALQFAFLLVFALFWGGKTPYACGENCNTRQKWQKVISVVVIGLGFYILFI